MSYGGDNNGGFGGGPPQGGPPPQGGGYGPPPATNNPGYYPAPAYADATNVPAIISVVTGGLSVASLGCCCIASIFAAIPMGLFGIVGLITGFVGIKKAGEIGGSGKALAIVGLCLGIAGLLMSIAMGLLLALGVGAELMKSVPQM